MIENPIEWPNRARCAVAFTFDMDVKACSTSISAKPLTIGLDSLAPALLAGSGHTSADRHIQTPRSASDLFVPGGSIERYPRAIRSDPPNGHEIGHHGYIHDKPNQLNRDDELAYLRRGIANIVNAREPGRAAIALHPTPFLNTPSICCWTRVSTMTPRFLATT